MTALSEHLRKILFELSTVFHYFFRLCSDEKLYIFGETIFMTDRKFDLGKSVAIVKTIVKNVVV